MGSLAREKAYRPIRYQLHDQKVLHTDAPSEGVDAPAAPDQDNRAEDEEILYNIHPADPEKGKHRYRTEGGGNPFPVTAEDGQQKEDSKKIERKDNFTHDQRPAVIPRHNLSGRGCLLMKEIGKKSHTASEPLSVFFSSVYFA